MLYLIFSPFKYLSITWGKGITSKKFFDQWFPCLISLLITFLLTLATIYSNEKANIFNNDITYYLTGFFQTIPGFYIAGLAAIATFKSTNMDVYMTDPSPLLEGKKVKRRVFLALLFSYLTILSLIVFFLTLLGRFTVSIGFFEKIDTYSDLIIYSVYCWIYFCFICQIVLTTCIGLYYLGEKAHTNDPKVMDDREIIDD
ncbi:hypothetical protein H0920_01940 [Acinetobacter sp. C_4_1]|uniref:hypothetical protein n=1 Tax=unclassified Acinetobacter TaxID=196816 RepID=UPI0021B81C71|nr:MULTISPECIES: hypothetical protein [unclassified Acinetobacter]MCT8088974.1 hypothetical protein [Acinetobacter sp. F_3_1]MCT8097130.1 hypothetical protein [Acinetobacter sp. C_3_1]MCT8099877.1 hypothetical protein [Acinetobacter sp. C_4_1]MCT8134276.1 hypothetical protein [Acinetobacter sp. T_3_1]